MRSAFGLASWVLVALVAFLAVAPVTHAGTAAAPDVVDPAGDVDFGGPPPPHPCADAVDLLSLWVEWTSEGVAFHYTFSDLSAVEGPPVQEVAGWCFYSYTDFELTRADGSKMVDALYVDYRGNPAFATGWRFFLDEAGDDAEGTVDIAAGTIDVVVPASALGGPGPGDSIGAFRVQSTSQFATAIVVADYATDLSPDAGPCTCQVLFPDAAAPTATASESQTASATTTPSASSSSSASGSTTSTSTTIRPPASTQPGATATSSSSTSEAPGSGSKDSPMPTGTVLLALIGLLAVRRRLD
jgi:MYXO-CTERM domain-containing protein